MINDCFDYAGQLQNNLTAGAMTWPTVLCVVELLFWQDNVALFLQNSNNILEEFVCSWHYSKSLCSNKLSTAIGNHV